MLTHINIDKTLQATLGIKNADLKTALEEANPIIRINKFDEEALKNFNNDINRAMLSASKIIPIVIDSYGGVVYSLLAMVDLIQTAKKTKIIATIVAGKAMSCGAALLSCGSEGYRFVGDNATVLIHEVSSLTYGKNEEIQADARQVKHLNKKLLRMMSENIGQPKNYFSELIHDKKHADWYLTPKECLKHNLANVIGTPTLKINISADIDIS